MVRVSDRVSTEHGDRSPRRGNARGRVEEDAVPASGFRIKTPGVIQIDRGERALGKGEDIVLAVRAERQKPGGIVAMLSDDGIDSGHCTLLGVERLAI